jgi:NADPH-dependent 2,4-dienoyl-CoA reductase/sulfur reductase-like enzyme
VATVGAGYIGIEIAEAIKRRGKNSLLFEMQECCLCGYYDRIMTSEMDEVLRKNGIELHYSEILKEIKTSSGNRVTSIVTDKGEYDVQMVLMSIGFAPRTELVQGKLETLKNGAIVVNTNQETSLKDVFAVGDCATVLNNSTGKTDYIALATNAIRSGIVAGHNVMGNKMESLGVQGSNGIGIFGYKMFSTGMTLDRANANGYDAACVDHEDLQKFAFMEPPNDKVKIRIVYDTKTRRVLGAQLASYMDVSLALHMFSLAVAKGVTIDELKLLDIFFMPHFNQVMNYITAASIKA